MLEYLHLKNVGPAPEMRMDLTRRLNLITGDNGLGKSFLLDIAWWTLTRTWAGFPARPPSTTTETSSIGFAFESKTGRREYDSVFNRKQQEWKGKVGQPANPGLVLYAQVDGGFGVWDPARNYWRTVNGKDQQDRPPSYQFSPREIWDGLERDGAPLCNGMVRDWASWQKENGRPFQLLKAALKVMSPSSEETLAPGALTRISLDDVRDMPTLHMPYGEDTPIVQASAGMRRISALVYLLVWAWEEHQRAAALLGDVPTQQVILLVDELYTHLHPRWQRVVLRALLDVVAQLMTGGDAQVQVLAATHSPLVLASVESALSEPPSAGYTWRVDGGTSCNGRYVNSSMGFGSPTRRGPSAQLGLRRVFRDSRGVVRHLRAARRRLSAGDEREGHAAEDRSAARGCRGGRHRDRGTRP